MVDRLILSYFLLCGLAIFSAIENGTICPVATWLEKYNYTPKYLEVVLLLPIKIPIFHIQCKCLKVCACSVSYLMRFSFCSNYFLIRTSLRNKFNLHLFTSSVTEKNNLNWWHNTLSNEVRFCKADGTYYLF